MRPHYRLLQKPYQQIFHKMRSSNKPNSVKTQTLARRINGSVELSISKEDGAFSAKTLDKLGGTLNSCYDGNYTSPL